MSQNIIVAVDGSEASKQALRWAASLLQDGDDLHIVTVRNLHLSLRLRKAVAGL